MIHILTLIVALVISGVAGFFSVYGIGIIFSGSFLAATIMGGVLELGKIVAVSWLYRNFKTASFVLRTYLIGAIVVLSLITSLGIFGFLSRAHLEQNIAINTGAASQVELIRTQIGQQKEAAADIDKRVTLINDALNKLITSNRAVTSLNLGDDQKRTRNQLNSEKLKIQEKINQLELEKVRLENETKRTQLDVGPIRYVTEMWYGNYDQANVDRTVRFLIIIIMLVFDPLAIALIIAANHGMMLRKQEKTLTMGDDPDTLRVKRHNIRVMDNEKTP